MPRPEDALQNRCAAFCVSFVASSVVWTAIEHGRRHAGTAEQRAREWQRLARKGVKTGLPDLLFIVPGFVLAVELKAAKGRQSVSQQEVEGQLRAQGHGYEIVRSVGDLGEALERHGIPLCVGWRVAAMRYDGAPKQQSPRR